VFALEGAGLVWLGLRQDRRIAEWTGIALQLIAAGAYLATIDGSIARDLSPIANAAFMSALIIALAAFASAWAYRNGLMAGLFYLWGLGWWVGNGGAEIFADLSADHTPDALLAFAALTGWIAAEVHRRRPAGLLALTTLFALIVAAPLASGRRSNTSNRSRAGASAHGSCTRCWACAASPACVARNIAWRRTHSSRGGWCGRACCRSPSAGPRTSSTSMRAGSWRRSRCRGWPSPSRACIAGRGSPRRCTRSSIASARRSPPRCSC
jgi:hypothetical protein